jgi:hypothetical protein
MAPVRRRLACFTERSPLPRGGLNLDLFTTCSLIQGELVSHWFYKTSQSSIWRVLLLVCIGPAFGQLDRERPPAAPSGLVTRAGDRSIVLHWDLNPGPAIIGYQIDRASSATGPFIRLTREPLAVSSFVDFTATNDGTCYYTVRAVSSGRLEGPNSAVVRARAQRFADDTAFLDYVQQTGFDYFWYESNPANGLVRDRSTRSSPSSIAAVGFGLTAIGIGIDHGWISRAQGRERTLKTLKTFWESPSGTNAAGRIGNQGWFYHFLDMDSATRRWNCELSSIDTALLLAGVLYAREYFDEREPEENSIRDLAESIFNRVNWLWMANAGSSLTHGWLPESGFLEHRWIGYNEAMILYVLGLGASKNPLPPEQWRSWTGGYAWRTNYGQAFVHFAPLFGHQYSHCWIDFRSRADDYLRAKGLSYFENSRRATIAQRAYCVANPGGFAGYGPQVWGLSACDGPGVPGFLGYSARGAPPAENDDGTIAPTAAAGSLPFAPEICLPALRFMYDRFRTNIWTGYGFRDGFNLQASWWGPDVLGIDQGPIVIMIENHRTGGVWKRFMKNEVIQRGLERAGFRQLPAE